MNLFYEDYPTAVCVEGREIPIVTDFREIVKLIDMLKTEDMDPREKMYFLLQYFQEQPEDFEKAVEALTDFVTMKEFYDQGMEGCEPGEESGDESPRKDVYSFSIDYPFIFSAFLQDYWINIRTIQYMHWWEFRMLFSGLSESTEIKQRIMYRSTDLSKINDKEERKRIAKIQQSIRLPDAGLTDYDIGNAFI